MAEDRVTSPSEAEPILGKKPPRTWVRVTRYILIRGLLLALLLTVGMYIAVMVANLGGYIDEIYRDRIEGAIQGMALAGEFRDGTPEQNRVKVEQVRLELEAAYGLNRPFLLRCVSWLFRALALEMVTPEILEAVPKTLLLISTSFVLLFLGATALSLYLSRRYGSFADRLVTALSPLSAAPSWVHGIILVAIFAIELHWLPMNRMFDPLPPANRLGYVLVVLKHMVLPISAILLSVFFQCVYAWRTFFLIHSSEDYVELARAKGLSERMLERRYILRPALPYFITSFALLLVGIWQEVLALEYFFYWPGIGKLYLDSVRIGWYNPYNVVGVMVIFGYLLAITVFALDIAYALVDPRVRLSGEGTTLRPVSWKGSGRRARPAAPVPGPQLGHTAPAPIRRDKARPAALYPRRSLGQALRGAGATLREIARFPSAIVGITVILAMVGVSLYAVIAIPYDRAVELWKAGAWMDNPRDARPAWTNWFRRDPLPRTVILDSQAGNVHQESKVISPEMTAITISLSFDYPYRTFPQDLSLNLTAQYREKKPLSYLTWVTPDGREISLGSIQLASDQTYVVSLDKNLGRKLKTTDSIAGVFGAPEEGLQQALPGPYELRVKTYLFESGSAVQARMVLYGGVHGLAGTDNYRRDLIVPLLWGTPVALALGLLGAVGSTLIAISVAALGVWFGGWVDRTIQWLSELNMLLPVLPLAILVYFFYTKNIWMILAVLIVLSSFGRALKNLRAALLQVRELPYMEAAQAYGAGNARIILRYMLPRVIPVLVPQLVIMVPGFVFLEATLAVIGVSDLYLPTWGKVMYDALTSGVLQDHYYRLLEPVALLMITGLAFAMLGYSLDRVFNPRLRSMLPGGQ